MNRGSDSFVWGIRWETVDTEDDALVTGAQLPGMYATLEMRNGNSAASRRKSRRNRIRSAAWSLVWCTIASTHGTKKSWGRNNHHDVIGDRRRWSRHRRRFTCPARCPCHLLDTAASDLCDACPNTGISLPERT